MGRKLIYLDAAIAVADYTDYTGLAIEDVKKVTDEVVKGLKQLPSAQSEQRWIPVTERLPEVGTYVLISKKALNFRSNLPNVCTAHRSCDPRSGKEEWNDMLFGKLDDDDVLAWMPLPEPYEDDPCNGCGYLGESCVGEGCGKLTERKEGEAE